MEERKNRASGFPGGSGGLPGGVLLAASALLVPLAMWLGFSDGVEFPKQVVFRCLAAVMALAVAANPALRARLLTHPLAVPLACLSLLALVSTALSGSPSVAWAGEEGSWRGSSTLMAVWLGALSASALAQGRLVLKWISAVLVAAALVLVYAFVQAFGADPVPWDPGKRITYWVMATLGNPVHLGNFLACSFFLTFAVMPFRSVPAWLFRFLLLAGVLMTLSRSALLALLAGGAVWFAFRRRNSARGTVLLAATPVVVLPFLAQAERIFSLTRLTGARPQIWEAAGRMIADRPLTGVGPDIFYSLFPLFSGYGFYAAEPPAVFGDSVFLRLPGSAHSEIFDTASMLGLPALGIYFWALAVVVRSGRGSILLPALAALWVGNQVNPSSVATSSLFWTLAAVIVRPQFRGVRTGKRGHLVFSVAVAAALFVAVIPALNLSLAQAYRRESGRLLFMGDRQGALALQGRWWKTAARAHPRQAAQDAALLSSGSPEEIIRAREMLGHAVESNPLSVFYLSALAELDFDEGRRLRNPGLLKSSEAGFRRALALAPAALSLHDDLARVLDAQGRRGEAEAERKTRREADPKGLFAPRPGGKPGK